MFRYLSYAMNYNVYPILFFACVAITFITVSAQQTPYNVLSCIPVFVRNSVRVKVVVSVSGFE